MGQACTIQTINGQRCVVCDEQPYVAPVASRVESDANRGWNASAHSVQRHAAGCQTTFTCPLSEGVVVGLSAARDGSDPRQLPIGVYLFEAAGAHWFQVVENGVPVTVRVPHVATDSFRIERIDGRAAVYRNGVPVHRKQARLDGLLMVVACLYSAGDGVD